jgi:hypothetical protein
MDDLQNDASEQTVSEESEQNESHSDPKVLEKRFRDSQSHIGKIQTENKELRSKLDQLIGRFEQIDRRETPAEKPWIDEISDETLRDDPSAVKAMLKRQREEFAEILEMRDRVFAERMKGYDPELRSNAEKIAKLREDPDLAKLPDEALLIIAKKYAKDEVVEADENEAPAKKSSGGAPMGAKRPTMVRKDESHEDRVKKYDGIFQQMYGKKNVVYGGKR